MNRIFEKGVAMHRIGVAMLMFTAVMALSTAVYAQSYESVSSQAEFSSYFAQPYSRVVRGNLWNDAVNANGLRSAIDTAAKGKPLAISYAEAYGTIENGDYRPSWGASSLWKAGAKAESIMHLRGFSMRGLFGFEHQEGKEMCGSMFINPGFYPVDIMEYTPGSKTLQTYTFDGNIAVDLDDSWRLGGEIDFRGSNYSKRKDLRHVNYGLHILFAPAVQYHSDNWALGLSYILSKDSENVDAEQIGTTGDVLYAFIDKGNSYGVYGIWDNSAIHLSEAGVKGFPIGQISNGFALQYSVGGFLGEFKWVYSDGWAGEKQFIWYKFHSTETALRLGYKFNERHAIRFVGSYFDQTNREQLLDKVTEGGVTTVRNLGSNQIFNRKIHRVNVQYNYDTKGFNLQVKGCWEAQHSVATVKYPFSGGNDMQMWMGDANAVWHFGMVDFGAELFWGNGYYGNSLWSVDFRSGVQGNADFEAANYLSSMLYNTGGKVGGNLNVRFNFKPGIWFELSEGLISGKVCKAGGEAALLPEPCNARRWISQLKVGYNF